MLPINKNTIQDKLFRLNENIKFIEDILRMEKEGKDILKDSLLYYGMEHLLQLSIEIIIDVGSHILAEGFNQNPKTYQDVILLLGDKGVIDKDFSEKQSEMAKFRNMIVHDYDNVDKGKVLKYAHSAPEIFRIFGKSFVNFSLK